MSTERCKASTTPAPKRTRRYEGLITFKIRFSSQEYSVLTTLAERYELQRTEVLRRLLNARSFNDLTVSLGTESRLSSQVVKKKKHYDEWTSFTIRWKPEEYAHLTHLSQVRGVHRTQVMQRLLDALGVLHGLYEPPQEKQLQVMS